MLSHPSASGTLGLHSLIGDRKVCVAQQVVEHGPKACPLMRPLDCGQVDRAVFQCRRVEPLAGLVIELSGFVRIEMDEVPLRGGNQRLRKREMRTAASTLTDDDARGDQPFIVQLDSR